MDRNEADTTNTIGDDLRAAMREAESGTPAAGESATGGDIPEAPAASQEPAAAPQERTDGRDAQGRFKPKDAATASQEPGAAPANGTQPQQRDESQRATLTLKPADQQAAAPVAGPPPGWSVPSKAAYAALPDSVKADIAKREQEVSDGFKRYEGLGRTMREFEQVLAPRMATFEQHGITPVQGVARLFAAFDALEHDTPRALVTLANEAGINLAQLAQMQGGGAPSGGNAAPAGQGGQPQFRDPRVDSVVNYINQMREQDAVYERETADQTIAQFAADPKNVYFENVRPTMVRLLQTPGGPQTLDQAYQWACAMNPEIQAALINERVAAEIQNRQKAQQERVTSARRAAGSLSGAPTPGSQGAAPPPKDSLRAELEDAVRASRA